MTDRERISALESQLEALLGILSMCQDSMRCLAIAVSALQEMHFDEAPEIERRTLN